MRVVEIRPNLWVREDGLVRNTSTHIKATKTNPEWWSGSLNRWGYRVVSLPKPGKQAKVHRLVAEAFLPNPDSKPYVDHINGLKTDNRVENLRWASHTENQLNQKRHRGGSLAGAHYRKGTNRWASEATIAGVRTYLGFFHSEQEAHEAYMGFIIAQGRAPENLSRVQ